MLYEIYFIKHYDLFFKEINFSLMSQYRHLPTTRQIKRVDRQTVK